MRATKTKQTAADRIRDHRRAHPELSQADIAHALNVSRQAVHLALRSSGRVGRPRTKEDGLAALREEVTELRKKLKAAQLEIRELRTRLEAAKLRT